MPRPNYFYFLQALLVFIVAVAIRVPLVEKDYRYTFEPDSESCVEETRSFYFFFKNPVKENIPHTLTSYPNYSDGDFIVAAAVGNVVRPLCKAGIITAAIQDSDNSLVIFSMRWTNVLLDAMAAVFAFLIVLLLARNSFIALSLTLLYYLLNGQTLHINFLRIDHFTLFASNLVMLATVLLLLYPQRKLFYILAGIAAGLVSATKINFPFYLVPLGLTVLVYLFQRKVSIKAFVIISLSFLVMFLLMYHRWRLYSENIHDVVHDTLQIGEQWFGFWGNSNPFYYLGANFFPSGFSWLGMLFMGAFYCAFICCVREALVKRNVALGILCVSFVIQSVALMLSPKISRYGTLLPLWAIIFIGYIAASFISSILVSRKINGLKIALAVLLLPMLMYEIIDYNSECAKVSLASTHSPDEALQWVKEHIKPNSVIAYQAPHVSNPPIFEMPFVFDEHYLTFPFLDKNEMEKFFPPTFDELRKNVNYIIISSKEKDYHLALMVNDNVPFKRKWHAFYDSLAVLPHVELPAPYIKNSKVSIYTLNEEPKGIVPTITISNIPDNDSVVLKIEANNIPLIDIVNFQYQISDDSSFRWLVSGSRDGYPSSYRQLDGKVEGNSIIQSMVPPKIMGAMMDGKFPHMLGHNPGRKKEEIELYFRKVLLEMVIDSLTFQEAFNRMSGGGLKDELRLMDSQYRGDSTLLNSHVAEYIKLTGLPDDAASLYNNIGKAAYTFVPATKLQKGKTYYWRARLRFKDQINSGWSNISRFEMPNIPSQSR